MLNFRKINILIDLLKLAYLDSKRDEDIDKEYIENIIDNFRSKGSYSKLSNEENEETKLFDLIEEMLNTTTRIDKDFILQNLAVIFKDNLNLFGTVKDYLNNLDNETDEDVFYREAGRIRKYLNNEIIKSKLEKISKKILVELKENDSGNKDSYSNKLLKLKEQLTEIENEYVVGSNDGVLDMVMMDDKASIENIMGDVKDAFENGLLYRMGWHDLNKMLQGGVRLGEYANITGLPSRYKSGLAKSMFASICLFNKPFISEDKSNLTPLNVFITLEEGVREVIHFLHDLIEVTETGTVKDLKDKTDGEMADFVFSRLNANGFKSTIIRVDPNDFTIHSFIRIMTDLRKKGFDVRCVTLDYIGKMSTRGCVKTGGTGTDRKDLISRVRVYCNPRGITFISPTQMNTKAKDLLDNGENPFNLVKTIAERGYYADSTQLDQEFDLSILVHKVVHEKKAYLTLQREKHRITTVIPEDDKYFILPFPKVGPIPFDINKDKKISFKSPTEILSRDDDNEANELFGF